MFDWDKLRNGDKTVLYTDSEAETAEYAAQLAGKLEAGCFIALDGGLGAGKTVFARGIARGLGVDEPVVSPTFTILRAYESGRLPLYHFDMYRIGPEGLEDVGYYEYAEGDGICLCEWASLIESELPEKRLDVGIRQTGGNEREITVQAKGWERA